MERVRRGVTAQQSKSVQEEINKLWTIKQLSDHFRVTVMTIHNWRRRGLPTVVIKGEGADRPTLRFVPNEVKQWYEWRQARQAA